ncbi:MAG: purine/pyrimidine permease [Chloroflexota bacterium]|nr:purine/pyrimidine permease [Chloroflexota bacterium]MDE2930542.1 purine/pyrimidine permease [Chloroflexota bacterium]
MATVASQSPRYEAHENPPFLATLGYGFQFSLLASATLLVTPVIVAKAAGRDDSYLLWMVFASLLVVGITTLLQVRQIGPVGGRAVLPMFTAAFSIPFCITAVVDGGPATLGMLVVVSGICQLIISKWLFILRRIVTPTVGGTVMMILSVTLASVVFALLDEASTAEPTSATVTALATLLVVSVLTFRGTPFLRLWAAPLAIVVGCLVAAAFGTYEIDRVIQAPWVGLPSEWPDLTPNFGIPFWTILPSFVFLGIIISIQANGESIALQRVATREPKAIDFRQVQGTLAGGGVGNILSGIAGAVPIIIHPGTVAFTQVTGVASRRVGYLIGSLFILMAFVPKVSGLLSTIPGPVMAGYLTLVTGTLFVDGAQLVISSEQNRQKVVVAGVSFWVGAAFQFKLFALPELGPVWDTLLKSGISTGGFLAIIMLLFLEFTSHRSMRFSSRLNIDALPDLNEFITHFSKSRGWDQAMTDRLMAVGEETLLTLAPLDLDLESDEEEGDDRLLVVLATSDGPVADLEFIGGGDEENLEDRIRQLQQHDSETPIEQELSLRLLRGFADSVQHKQYQDNDVITVRVTAPES